MMEQLLLFEESLEGKLLREVKELKESVNKIRKGQFAKIGELGKICRDLSERMDIIEAGLCKANLDPPQQSSKIYEFALI